MPIEIDLFGRFEVINYGVPLRQLTTDRLSWPVAFPVFHRNHDRPHPWATLRLWPEAGVAQAPIQAGFALCFRHPAVLTVSITTRTPSNPTACPAVGSMEAALVFPCRQ